jgi:hypothetical protein
MRLRAVAAAAAVSKSYCDLPAACTMHGNSLNRGLGFRIEGLSSSVASQRRIWQTSDMYEVRSQALPPRRELQNWVPGRAS